MHISTFLARQRGLPQEHDDGSYSCDEEDKQHFAQLLTASSPHGLSPADTLNCTEEELCHPLTQWEGINTTTSVWQMKKTMTSAWLQWRLSNGPLAGMEIAARGCGDNIHIRLQSQDFTRLLHLVESAQQLEQQLSCQFNSHITVEIVNANTTVK
jgi:hypothetical protein